jgi:FixJ family two-component response regulator
MPLNRRLRLVVNLPVPIVVAVEDDFRVRESLESLVASAGYEPVVFSSAEEFLQSGTLAAATCVITDVRMPGMDGIELQRRIRQARPRLPVIFISGHNNIETRQTALDEGAVDFLYKPFDAADLLAAIHTALEKAQEQ